MKAEELRIGNLVEYKINDKFDDRKEWWEVSEIDADDIHWLSKVDKEDENFRQIPLTEEWLLKFGFEKDGNDLILDNGLFLLVSYNDDEFVHLKSNHLETIVSIKYLHQLQNLYFALTGIELLIIKISKYIKTC